MEMECVVTNSGTEITRDLRLVHLCHRPDEKNRSSVIPGMETKPAPTQFRGAAAPSLNRMACRQYLDAVMLETLSNP